MEKKEEWKRSFIRGEITSQMDRFNEIKKEKKTFSSSEAKDKDHIEYILKNFTCG